MIYRSKLSKLSKLNESKITYGEEQSIRILLQVLNSDDNNSTDVKDVAKLFQYYRTIAKKYASKEFIKSMTNSIEILKSRAVRGDKLDDLKKDRADSFLHVTLNLKNHVFSGIIRKKEGAYSLTVINKGLRGESRNSHIEYFFSKRNIQELMKTIKKDHENSDSLYGFLSSKALKVFPLKVKSIQQKEGNCFIKEPENAIKFALATASYRSEDFNQLRFSKESIQIKWPVNTAAMHRQIVLEGIKENPRIAVFLRDTFNNYVRNKKLRKWIKRGIAPLPALDFSMDSKRRYVSLPRTLRLKELLKQINLDTLSQCHTSIYQLVILSKDREYVKTFEDLLFLDRKLRHIEGLEPIQITNNEKYLKNLINNKGYQRDLMRKLEKGEKDFPSIASYLKRKYAPIMNNIALNYYKSGEREEAFHALRFSLKLNPESTDAHWNKAILLNEMGYKVLAKFEFNQVLEKEPQKTKLAEKILSF